MAGRALLRTGAAGRMGRPSEAARRHRAGPAALGVSARLEAWEPDL